MKKLTAYIIIITVLLGAFSSEEFATAAAEATTVAITTAVTATATAATATPTDSKILVNGADVVFTAYLIYENNYFKLRDIAYTLSGTEKQFEVGWDGANNAISLTSGLPYTIVGDEMAGGDDVGAGGGVGGDAGGGAGASGGVKTALTTSARIFKDGKEVKFTAYNIDGYNYFKLRDIGEAFDFGVEWDDARNTIAIDTGKEYTPAIDDSGNATASTSTTTPDDAGKTPSGTNNINMTTDDYLEVYGELLATWKSDLKKHNNDEQVFGMTFEFWFYNGYSDDVKTYYALYDIDGNGVKELLLKKKDNAGYEEILAYIFTLKDGKPISLFGYEDSGVPREVPWSRVGSGEILINGLIDCYYADYKIYQIADNGYSLVVLAYAEPYDYPDEAGLAEAKWRHYIYGDEVDYDYYKQYLADLDYEVNGKVILADIDWVSI